MKITGRNIFEGRNIYSHKKCIRLDLDLEGYCEIPSNKIDGFNERLINILPELRKHRCGIDEDMGFVKRLKEGTYLSHICEHIIIALQNMIGIDTAYGKSREISGDRYYVIYQYEYKNSAIEAGNIAVDMINALINKKDFNFKARFGNLKLIFEKEVLGPSTTAICDEVRKRGIPLLKIGEESIFQLGYGKNSKLIEATINDNTGTVAVDIACDKLLTKEILYRQCLPVAVGGKARNRLELLLEAESIGYPVVLKPRYGNQGKGVLVNIKDEKELLNAYETLTREFQDVIIEKYVGGRDFRVCIVDGEIIAVAERIPPYVVGDGRRTIRELIDEVNKDLRRGEGHEKPLTRIKIDHALVSYIAKKQFTLDSVLAKKYKLTLRENANLSTGGVAIDCTDIICEENKEICKRAAMAVGLNVCGIDLCCKDISKPIVDSGVIIEVNAAPGIRMHHYPYRGKSRNVAGAIVNSIFKGGADSIPLVSVTGTNGKTTTTRLIGYTLGLVGFNVGMTTTGGIYINNKCIEEGDTTGPKSALTVLTNKEIDAAVLETARGGIIREGLAYDLADVAVITNITEDHLGIDEINTMEELSFVKSLVAEAVKADGYVVINADDKISLTILDRLKSNIIFFSKDKNNESLRRNIRNDGFGIYIDNGYLYVEKQDSITALMKVEDIRIAFDGKLIYNIENAMAACAALVGLGIDYSIIKKGLTDFSSDAEHNPGRFNMYRVGDASVILDYGHNIEGYKAVLDGADSLEHKRLVGIIGVPGDRLNSNVSEVGKISGGYFDYIYIKEDQDKRGRKSGEIAEILKKGVLSSGFNSKNLEIVLDESEALIKAVDNAEKGDLIIIFFEKYEPLIKIVQEKIKNCTEVLKEIYMA